MRSQEEALAPEFTMREMMYYFGIIFNMKLSYIKKRTEFLRKFLQLKTADVMCKSLRWVWSKIKNLRVN